MRRRSFLTAAALVVLSFAASAQTPAPTPAAIDITGKWNVAMDLPQIGAATPILDLKQDGTKITGTYTGRYAPAKLEGTLDDKRALQFAVSLEAEGQPVTMYFRAEVSADGQAITKGTVSIEGLGDGTWEAKRAK